MQFKLQVTYPPAATLPIISLPDPTQSALLFDATSQVIYAGAATITISAGFGSPPTTWIATQSITYTYIDPCVSTSLTTDAFATVTVGRYSPGTTTFTLWLDQVSSSQTNLLCGPIQYTHTVTSSPASYVDATMNNIFVYTQSSTQMLLTITPNQNAQIGSYIIQTCGKLSNYSTIFGCVTSSVIINCQVTSLEMVQQTDGGPLAAQEYYLNAAVDFQYPLQSVQTPDCGCSVSSIQFTTSINSQYYFLFGTPRTCPQLQITSTSGMYTLTAPLTSVYCIGIHQIQIAKVILSSGQIITTLTGTSLFALDIRQSLCAFSTVISAPISDFTVNAFVPISSYGTSPSYTVTIPAGATSCPIIYQISYSLGTALAFPTTFSVVDGGSTISFSVQSSLLSQVGTTKIYVYGYTSTNCLYGSCEAVSSFTLTIKNPCVLTSLIPPSTLPTDFSTSVLIINGLGNPLFVTQQVGVFKDQVSVAYGTGTGVDICGSRTYSISSVIGTSTTSLSATELSITALAGLISLYTANSAKIGTHLVTVQVALTNYPAISTSCTLTITIDPCIITSFITSTSSPVSSKVYGLTQSTVSWSYAGSSITTQVPACGYQLSVSATGQPAVLQVTSGSTISFQLFSRSLADCSIYPVQISTSIVAYPYASLPPNSQSFSLSIIDPCPISVITGPTQIENISAFVGYTSLSLLNYVYQDTASVIYTLPTDSGDFCGVKKLWFNVNNQNTTIITVTKNGQIQLSPTKLQSTLGSQTVSLIVYLDLYPAVVSSTLHFTTTVFDVEVPKITDQVYKVSQSPLSIDLMQFSILPTVLSTQLQLTGPVQVFLTPADTQIPLKIDLTCSCLTPISQYSWLTLSGNQLQVQSSDNSIAGFYQIVVVQKVNTFPEVLPYTNFKLLVEQVITSVNLTPNPRLVEIVNVIGEVNESILLKKFYSLPVLSQPYTVSFTFVQTAGPTITSAKIITDLSSFNMSVNDTSLSGSFALFQFTATTDLSTQVPNNQLTIKIKFRLKDVSDGKTNYTFNQTETIQRSKSTPYPLGVKPAQIVDVTPTGILKIKFFRAISVPNFTIGYDTATKNASRQLSLDANLTLQEYLNNKSLSISLKTNEGSKKVDWVSKNLTEMSLIIQLNFENPIDVSSQRTDSLVVNFLDPDFFILKTRTQYLFQDATQLTLTFGVPPQFTSASTQALFNSLAASSQQVGAGIIVVTLLLQIVAKKIITYMWVYYSALQIILIVNQQSKIQMPASVQAIISAIDGIVNLSSLDKKAVAAKMKLDSLFAEGSFLNSLGSVSLAIIGIVIVIIAIVACRCLCRHPKVLALLIKVRDMLFWNFLIRYFQASYLNFNYAGLTVVFGTDIEAKKLVTSAIILVFQYGLVALIFYILMSKPHYYFQNESTKKKIGNLYSQLDTKLWYKLVFGVMFYIQRSFVVLILCAKMSGGVQWCLLTLVFVGNSIYLFAVQPYQTKQDGVLDQVNCIMLLIFTSTQAGMLSLWVEDAFQRFQNGVYFDVFLGVCMIVNFGYVISALFGGVVLKFKRARYRCKRRDKQKFKQHQLVVLSANANNRWKNPQSLEILMKLREMERKGMGQHLKKIRNQQDHQDQELRLEDIESQDRDLQQFKLEVVNQKPQKQVSKRDKTQHSQHPNLTKSQLQLDDMINQVRQEIKIKQQSHDKNQSAHSKTQEVTKQKVKRPNTPGLRSNKRQQNPIVQQLKVQIPQLNRRQPTNYLENTRSSIQNQTETNLQQEYTGIMEAKTKKLEKIPSQVVNYNDQYHTQDLEIGQISRPLGVFEFYDMWQNFQDNSPFDKVIQKKILIEEYKRRFPTQPLKPICFTQAEYNHIIEQTRQKLIITSVSDLYTDSRYVNQW